MADRDWTKEMAKIERVDSGSSADRDGFREKDFKEAMERLLRGSKPSILIEEYGPPSNRHARLVRAAADV